MTDVTPLKPTNALEEMVLTLLAAANRPLTELELECLCENESKITTFKAINGLLLEGRLRVYRNDRGEFTYVTDQHWEEMQEAKGYESQE